MLHHNLRNMKSFIFVKHMKKSIKFLDTAPKALSCHRWYHCNVHNTSSRPSQRRYHFSPVCFPESCQEIPRLLTRKLLLPYESLRTYSKSKQEEKVEPLYSEEAIQDEPNQDKSVKDVKETPKSILTRFKEAYKEYGKVLIGVHLVTSSVWFGTFFYAAFSGLDIVPFLKWMNFSQGFIHPFETSGVGNLAVAYLLYKLATPARYTVTILGTQYTVRYLRHLGYMPPVPEGSRIRDLIKDSKVQVKEKYEDFKDNVREKRDEYKDTYEEQKEKYRDTLQEKYKEKFKKR